MKTSVVIVGAGLFGSAVSKMLKAKGFNDVILIDSKKKGAASKCSAGVWKDSWINKSIRNQYDISLPVIEKNFGLEEVSFVTEKGSEKFLYTDKDWILESGDNIIDVDVVKVSNLGVVVNVGGVEQKILASKAVVVACGAYTDILLLNSGYPLIGINRLWGTCLHLDSSIKIENKMSVWAPYRQSVYFRRYDGSYYFGDGSTVKNPTANDKRFQKVKPRLIENLVSCTDVQRDEFKFKSMTGFRPYIDKGKDFIHQVDKRVFVATGGAKNSTILSGYIGETLSNQILNLK